MQGTIANTKVETCCSSEREGALYMRQSAASVTVIINMNDYDTVL